ncbi:hypothetical protein EVD33_13485 [Bacteroidales bacterium SW292]|nr:hypothetical protein [Bacteroidales bacterium SW292]
MIREVIAKLKNNDIQLPIWMGQMLSNIPYSIRPIVGKYYRIRKKEIKQFDEFSIEEKQKFIFDRVYNIVKYSLEHIPFYQKFYGDQGFSLDCIKSFADIKKIPVINKSILLQYSLEERSNENEPHFTVNTGGSSGQTLSFYVQPSSIGNEWAHIHNMWSKIGFHPSNLKLYVAGRSKVRNGVDYEFARHTLSLDMYQPFEKTAPILKKILEKSPCYYLHGYPSVLSEFAEYCKKDVELLALLKGKLRGAFLSSEYPYPMYRDVIENVFDISTQSFYGHTERCVMAYETLEKFKFKPFQTYGFAEAERNEDGHFDLIGTSYYNLASPLIRYNTQDIIDNPTYEGGMMNSFDIFEGRSGQFILDNNDRKISLTGLVMGRHHQLFDYCSHIQISQTEKGKAIIYYVLKKMNEKVDAASLFDSSNVDIEFTFNPLTEPIRTVSGKVNLLVK